MSLVMREVEQESCQEGGQSSREAEEVSWKQGWGGGSQQT